MRADIRISSLVPSVSVNQNCAFDHNGTDSRKIRVLAKVTPGYRLWQVLLYP